MPIMNIVRAIFGTADQRCFRGFARSLPFFRADTHRYNGRIE
jgi:hypothetical protein